jgi:outer membrane protein
MRSLVLFILCFQINNLAAQDSVQVLNLDDCIRIGIESSTHALLSKDSVRITGAQLLGAYGQFLPNLNFNGLYNYNTGKNLLTITQPELVQSKSNLLNYELSSTVNIFNGLYDYSTLRAAKLTKSASQYNFQRAVQQIKFDLTQSYLQVVLDRRISAFAKDNLKVSDIREEQLKALADVGRKTMSDYYQQVAQTSSDSLYLIQTEDKLKNDIISLFQKLRITETEKYALAEMQPDSTPLGPEYQNVQDLIGQALKQRPDIRSSELYEQVADWNIKQYRSTYMPKLNFDYGLVSNGGYLDQLYVNNVNALGPQEAVGKALFGQVYGSLGLNLTWQIFDRFATRTNIDIAKIYRQNTEILHDDLVVEISSELKQAYNDYISALQQMQTTDRGLFAARQAFEVVQGRYNVGQATFVELSNAQIVYLQTEVSKAQASVGVALQKKIIDYYLGK